MIDQSIFRILGNIIILGFIVYLIIYVIKEQKETEEYLETSKKEKTYSTKRKYRNHCWKCGSKITSEINRRCNSCGWYICSHCGACDYYCQSSKRLNDILKKQDEALELIRKRVEEEREIKRIEAKMSELGIKYDVDKTFIENKLVLMEKEKEYLNEEIELKYLIIYNGDHYITYFNKTNKTIYHQELGHHPHRPTIEGDYIVFHVKRKEENAHL